MYNKKAFAGAFLAFAVTAAATGNVAFAKENGVDAQANVSHEGKGVFGRLVDNLRADVKLHAEKRHVRSDEDRQEQRRDDRASLGLAIVTDIDGDTIYADSHKDETTTSWTITTDTNTRFSIRGDRDDDQDLEDIAVGDRISVTGDVTDNDGGDRAIDADVIVRRDPVKARAAGTVTDVNSDGTVVLDTKHQGDVTVAIDSDTTIKDGNDEGALAYIAIGTRLYVKGMWDSVKEAIVAAKVRILG